MNLDFPQPFPDDSPTLGQSFRAFFENRRRQLQDWETDPPHGVALLLVFFVALEMALAQRLTSRVGFDMGLIRSTMGYAAVILLSELVLAKIAGEIALLFQKNGRYWNAVTLLSMGLLPLLLILPVTLVSWSMGPHTALIRLLIVIVLFAKVLANWREAMEISFELSRLQSALVLYASSTLFMILLALVAYVSFFGAIMNVLTELN